MKNQKIFYIINPFFIISETLIRFSTVIIILYVLIKIIDNFPKFPLLVIIISSIFYIIKLPFDTIKIYYENKEIDEIYNQVKKK